MAGMTADEVYVLLGDEITLLTEEVKQMEGWEPIEHKGTVQTAEDLPADAKKGWMYNIATDSVYGAAGMNVVMTSKGWDPMGPIINMNLYLTKEEGTKSFQPKGNYLSGTDTDLKESGKAADAKATGEKIAKNSSDIAKKLGKNQGSENSGKVAGINEVGDIVPMFPMGVEYNSETNCLEFGSDQKMKLNQGIGLDNTLTKSGSAADAGVTGKKIDSLKEDIANRSVVNGGKNLIGNEANRLYAVGYIPANTNFTMSMKDGGLLTGANLGFYDSDKKYINYCNAYKDNATRTLTIPFGFNYIELNKVIADRPMQFEIGDKATDFEDYVPNVAESMKIASEEFLKLHKSDSDILGISSGINTGIAQSLIFSSFGYYKSGNLVSSLGNYGEKITAEFYNQGTSGTSRIQSLFGMLKDPIAFSETKTLYCIITSSISATGSVHLSKTKSWGPETNPLVGEIKVKEGTHCYKIKFNKQFSDEHYLTPSDFYYVLFEFSSVTPFDNLVFDAYFFDNENLYDLIGEINQNKLEYDYEIIFWGDSLTAGAGGGGTTYPRVCAEELGISNYLNAGVGGETANTIACRNGANSMIIPVGDVNGDYTIGELKDAYGTNILPLRQGNGGNTINPITINGYKCTLTLSQANSTDPNAIYTISGYKGDPIKYPMTCKMSGCDLSTEITVIFVGQNGPSFEQRLSVIDSMISKTNGKYVILTLSSGTEEQMKSQEATMLSKYGNHLFKTREMLSKYGLNMCGITPTSDDETAMANGSVPPSLRTDSVHLNANGYTALGKMLASHIRSLGYVI